MAFLRHNIVISFCRNAGNGHIRVFMATYKGFSVKFELFPCKSGQRKMLQGLAPMTAAVIYIIDRENTQEAYSLQLKLSSHCVWSCWEESETAPTAHMGLLSVLTLLFYGNEQQLTFL